MATNSASVKTAASLVRASHKAYARKWSFLALFVVMFFVSYRVAGALDLLPEPSSTTADASSTPLVTAPVVAEAPELPTKIEIPSIGVSAMVANPSSTNVEILDDALLGGVVRYPSSSKLGEAGNVIILGHSSYLPIVNNKAFKAFNGIQDLEKGDLITVTGTDYTYVYAVETVEEQSAIDGSIPLSVVGSKLTLATCDSFGKKTDRFVVTATLIETKSL